ncbi:hypothetical protein RclHR1_03910009 [Rhizophagus clarus]|uniref:Protein kinase domain-containing protein n=1 Tax=Rhizophagus clarus TaxID=94130 RepID=A0A2Z6RVT9_9GLOM|nr:hypothetical protein RclHR1_03910009 [Rhizophagus clarus]
MDLIKLLNTDNDINEEDSFDPTPKLKSNPIPINFIPFRSYNSNNLVFESEKYCTLYEKPLYQRIDYENLSNFVGIVKYEFKLSSDCYLISSGYIESTLTEELIPIIYLPWWHDICFCDACGTSLKHKSDCQKYCEKCLIFYTGCRYCLTTNVIVGITNQSQCKKCNRMSSIIYDAAINISTGNNDLDDFLVNLIRFCHKKLKIVEFSDKIKNIDRYFLPPIYYSIYQEFKKAYARTFMELIPYHFSNLKSNLHRFIIEQNTIKTYGFTKDPKSNEFMLVMQYASGGDLHNFLQKHFAVITLETIHEVNYIHRDFHSGNILCWIDKDAFNFPPIFIADPMSPAVELMLEERLKFEATYHWLIGDLGLSQPESTTPNNELYGVIPYIAPEIFKGSPFSKESDVYSMGMIMWELTTGCKYFANIEHGTNLILRILDGERPEITEDTPECYANLMKSCWILIPKKDLL